MTNKRFSRYLSAMLRHRAIEHGYQTDNRGFVHVDQILEKCQNINFTDIQEIVQTDNKKRFELLGENGKWLIRAVQGHTIPNIDPDLKLVTDPKEIPVVVHGTNIKAFQNIKNIGLSRMERNHIHFASGTVTDPNVISGMRKNANVMIYIDVPKCMNAGIKFYTSLNGVILSEGINGIIAPHFFKTVELIQTNNV